MSESLYSREPNQGANSSPSESSPAHEVCWLDVLSAQRRASNPTFAESESRAQADGSAYVVEAPIEGDDGEIGWVAVAEGGDEV